MSTIQLPCMQVKRKLLRVIMENFSLIYVVCIEPQFELMPKKHGHFKVLFLYRARVPPLHELAQQAQDTSGTLQLLGEDKTTCQSLVGLNKILCRACPRKHMKTPFDIVNTILTQANTCPTCSVVCWKTFLTYITFQTSQRHHGLAFGHNGLDYWISFTDSRLPTYVPH